MIQENRNRLQCIDAMSNSLRKVADSDIRLLGVFHKVVSCGGLSAAELELNIGRSTISRHLKDLEIRLGVKLCHRGRSRFRLTYEGQVVYQASIKLFEQLDDFKKTVNEIQDNLKGTLSIGVFDKVAGNPECKLHEAVSVFIARHPDIKIEIHTEPLNDIENKVMRGELQLGVVPMHRKSKSLEYDALFKENMLLYCGVGHELYAATTALQAADLSSYRFACMGFNSPNMDLCDREGIEQSAVAYDQEGVAILVKSGRYLGFLPEHYADDFVRAGEITRVHCEGYSYNCDFAVISALSIKPERPASEFKKALKQVHER